MVVLPLLMVLLLVPNLACVGDGLRPVVGVRGQRVATDGVVIGDMSYRYVFSATKYSQILSRRRGGGGVCDSFFGEEGYGRINGGTRVLGLAADSWKAALGHGAR
jgi:hypothetical protein